jgi:hypothetical protein
MAAATAMETWSAVRIQSYLVSPLPFVKIVIGVESWKTWMAIHGTTTWKIGAKIDEAAEAWCSPRTAKSIGWPT